MSKSHFLLTAFLLIFVGCSKHGPIVDSNGKAIDDISYEYLTALKAEECVDVYKEKRRKSWMPRYLRYNKDIDFLTSREMSNSEAKSVLEQKMDKLINDIKEKNQGVYFSGSKISTYSTPKIKLAKVNKQTNGLLLEGLYKHLEFVELGGFKPYTPTSLPFEYRAGSFFDDSRPRKYPSGNVRYVQEYQVDLPQELLAQSPLVEYNGRLYLQFPKGQLREKVKKLVSSNEPIEYTATYIMQFNKCSKDSTIMSLIKFQLIDSSTEAVIIDWQK